MSDWWTIVYITTMIGICVFQFATIMRENAMQGMIDNLSARLTELERKQEGK